MHHIHLDSGDNKRASGLQLYGIRDKHGGAEATKLFLAYYRASRTCRTKGYRHRERENAAVQACGSVVFEGVVAVITSTL